MTKTLKFLTALIALTLATPALAQGPGVTPPPMGGDDEVSTNSANSFYVYLHWYRSGGLLNSAPLAYADGTPLQGGDVVALLFVMPEEGVTFGADGELPFSINADGSVALKTGAKRAVWAGYQLASVKDKGIAIDPEAPGFPKYDLDAATIQNFAFLWPHEVEGVGSPETCVIYLVVLGSRVWEWDSTTQQYVSVSANTNPLPEGNASLCELPSCVTEWNAVWCKNVIVTDRFMGGLQADITVNLSDEAYAALITAESSAGTRPFADYLNGVVADVDKSPTLEKATVDGQELSGADLEAALKPSISGMVATTIAGEDGAETPAFTFDFTPAPLPGLSTYTLYTATDLAGPWEPFDKVLDKVLEEKELANPSGMRYTTLRIDGEESVPVTIPRLENDPTRFYRLQGDVEVVTTGQEGE